LEIITAFFKHVGDKYDGCQDGYEKHQEVHAISYLHVGVHAQLIPQTNKEKNCTNNEQDE
jgi:hypothetical protein